LSHNFPKRSTFDLQPVHNIYLLLLAELGFFGLALFLTLIISAWNLIRTSKKYLLTALPLIACLLIGLFDHYFMTQYAGLIMFWLALTISLEFANMNFQE